MFIIYNLNTKKNFLFNLKINFLSFFFDNYNLYLPDLSICTTSETQDMDVIPISKFLSLSSIAAIDQLRI